MRLEVVGCSPAWPNPGGAQSGYLVEGPGRVLLDCGPGVLARMRQQKRVAGGGRDRRSRTSTSTTGATSSPWVWGRMYGLGRDLPTPGSSGCSRAAARELRELRRATSVCPTCSSAPSRWRETYEDEEFEAARAASIKPVRLTPLHAPSRSGFRVLRTRRQTLAYSGDSGPSERLAELGARRRSLPVRGDARARRAGRAAARTPLAGRSV